MVNVSINDYYEDLQISPNADMEMIERVFDPGETISSR